MLKIAIHLGKDTHSVRHDFVNLVCKHTDTHLWIPDPGDVSRELFCLSKTVYFVLSYSQLAMLSWFQVDSEGLSHTCTRIHSPPNSPPIQSAT